MRNLRFLKLVFFAVLLIVSCNENDINSENKSDSNTEKKISKTKNISKDKTKFFKEIYFESQCNYKIKTNALNIDGNIFEFNVSYDCIDDKVMGVKMNKCNDESLTIDMLLKVYSKKYISINPDDKITKLQVRLKNINIAKIESNFKEGFHLENIDVKLDLAFEEESKHIFLKSNNDKLLIHLKQMDKLIDRNHCTCIEIEYRDSEQWIKSMEEGIVRDSLMLMEMNIQKEKEKNNIGDY